MSHQRHGFPRTELNKAFNTLRIGGDPDPNVTGTATVALTVEGTSEMKQVRAQDLFVDGGVDLNTLRSRKGVATEKGVEFFTPGDFEALEKRWCMDIDASTNDVSMNRVGTDGSDLGTSMRFDYASGATEITSSIIQSIQGPPGVPLTITSAPGQDIILDAGSDNIRFSDDNLIEAQSINSQPGTDLSIASATNFINFNSAELGNVTQISTPANQSLRLVAEQNIVLDAPNGIIDFLGNDISAGSGSFVDVTASSSVTSREYLSTVDLNIATLSGEVTMQSGSGYNIEFESGSGQILFNNANLVSVGALDVTSLTTNTITSDSATLTLQSDGAFPMVLNAGNGVIDFSTANLTNIGATLNAAAALTIGTTVGSITLNPNNDRLDIDADVVFTNNNPTFFSLDNVTVNTAGVTTIFDSFGVNVEGSVKTDTIEPRTGSEIDMSGATLNNVNINPSSIDETTGAFTSVLQNVNGVVDFYTNLALEGGTVNAGTIIGTQSHQINIIQGLNVVNIGQVDVPGVQIPVGTSVLAEENFAVEGDNYLRGPSFIAKPHYREVGSGSHGGDIPISGTRAFMFDVNINLDSTIVLQAGSELFDTFTNGSFARGARRCCIARVDSDAGVVSFDFTTASIAGVSTLTMDSEGAFVELQWSSLTNQWFLASSFLCTIT